MRPSRRLAPKIGSAAGTAYRARGSSLPMGIRHRSTFKAEPSLKTIAVVSLADAMELLRKALAMPVISYSAGISVVTVSLYLAYHLQTFLDKSSLFVVLAGVIFSAWLGGLEVGLTCLALGVLGTKFFLLPPTWSFHTAVTSDLIRLACFLVVGFEAVWLIAKNHRPGLNERSAAREIPELAPVIAITPPPPQQEETISPQQEAPPALQQEAPAPAKSPPLNMEWIPDACIMFDVEWQCTDLNEKAAELWHRAKNELIGKSLGEMLPDGAGNALYAECIRSRNDGVARRFEYRDGLTDRWYAGHAAPLESGVAVYLRDITDAKRDEEMLLNTNVASPLPPQKYIDDVEAIKQSFLARIQALEQANAELERLGYAVFDDLQGPLRTAIMCLDLLKKHGDAMLDSAAANYLSSALNGAQLTQARMQDLISYSEIGTREKKVERVDCEKLLDLTIRKMKEAIERSEVVITYATLPTVHADPAQLGQVFENLIDNSIKFRSDSGPYIHICAERHGRQWLFSIKDNGIGIEAQYLEHIFMLFRRLPSAAEHPGTGMGLAVCRKIIQRHGGQIWAESQTGKGATFYFTVPEEISENTSISRHLAKASSNTELG